MKSIAVERLRKSLFYDPDTGAFMWQQGRGPVRAGDIAGCYNGDGYIVISIDGEQYLAHCLAWLYQTGEWAPSIIDHRNTQRDDNRWLNLKLSNHSANGLNRAGADRDSRTGVLGVSPSRGKFKASICVNKKTLMLGRFATIEEAQAVREIAHAAILRKLEIQHGQ